MVKTLLRLGLELAGLALIVYAGWRVSVTLGVALAGLTLLNFAFTSGGRPRT